MNRLSNQENNTKLYVIYKRNTLKYKVIERLIVNQWKDLPSKKHKRSRLAQLLSNENRFQKQTV